ncbi:hypothetical protein [Bradyrhizobium centrosematis]
MPTKRNRLAVRIFRLVEGEAEGYFAISVFLIIALATLGLAAWRLHQ